RGRDPYSAAELAARNIRTFRKQVRPKRLDLEDCSLIEGAFGNAQLDPARSGDGAAAGPNSHRTISGNKLAAGEVRGRPIGSSDGNLQDVVDGAREVACQGTIVEGGKRENHRVRLVDDRHLGSRRQRARRCAGVNVPALVWE